MKDLLYLNDDQIKDFIEQIFYAYKKTYNDPRNILNKYSFGTAHHRAISLIERNEGVTISGLLSKLEVTKQSLNRVLRELKRLKIVKQIKDTQDTRKKLLYLDRNGKEFYDKIFETQKKRIFNALKDSDSESVIHFKEVLKKIVNGKK